MPLSVIMVAPTVAGVLVWTPFRRAGALTLALSMLGALLFGVYHHFVAPGVDHISSVPATTWGARFRQSAVVLAIIGGWGTVLGWWSVRRISRAGGEA